MRTLEQWLVLTVFYTVYDASRHLDGKTIIRHSVTLAALLLLSDGVWFCWCFFQDRKRAL